MRSLGLELGGRTPQQVVCFGAHCDDIAIGMGGTLRQGACGAIGSFPGRHSVVDRGQPTRLGQRDALKQLAAAHPEQV